MLTASLLVLGLVFPVISWVTLVLARWTSWRTGRNVSAVFIPLAGPVLLTSWVIFEDKSYWLIPICWIADIGTAAFLYCLPAMVAEWWRTSHFTLCLRLHGNQGTESAVLTLHSGGHYQLTKSWDRPAGTFGIVSLGEPGTYIRDGDKYELTAHHGLRRTLVPIQDSILGTAYSVVELSDLSENQKEYTLAGWTLQA